MTTAICEPTIVKKSDEAPVLWEWVSCNLCGVDDTELFHQERLAYFGKEYDFKVVRCRNCGLVYTNPRLRDYNATYLQSEDGPEDIERHAQAKAPVFERALKEIIKWQKRQGQRSRGSMLDVGCGSGHFLSAARQCGYTVAGIEPAKVLAEYAGEVLGIPVYQREVQDIRFPFEGFDVITAWDVIEHVSDPYTFLRRCGQWLRPDGIMALRFPSSSWQKIKGVVIQDWLSMNRPAFSPSIHLHFFSARTFERMARRVGLEVLRIRTTTAEANTNSAVGDCLKAMSHLTLRGIEMISRKHLGNLEVYCRKARA
ncbi:MAG: class I SAM-dependent methyltransferase [Planctomycetes bacterium]|nr:class I SAM-dependent methyltransferase [Planctomycetota bacterium]